MLQNKTPYAIQLFSGYNQQGKSQLTCVVKASYRFNTSGKLIITDSPSEIYSFDQPYQNSSCIEHAEESMPFKQGGELLINGWITPKNVSDRYHEVLVKLKKNEDTWQKQLIVFGKRYWLNTLIGPRISKPDRLSPTLLSYEQAYGGPNFAANPTGKGHTKRLFRLNHLPLPQIELAKHTIRWPHHQPCPAGFGPIAKHWQPRVTLHKGAKISKPQQAAFPNAPKNLHNVAPLDQQFKTPFQGGEQLYISGLSNDKPVQISLPKIALTLLPEKKPIIWDTISIDMHQCLCHLIGRAPLTTQDVIDFQ